MAELERIESHLGASLDRLFSFAGMPALEALQQCMRQYVLRGGKRLRPQLCIWTAEHISDAPREGIFDVACAWEIFHAFLLVHDDLIDSSDFRRETPSLHRQLQNLDHDSPQFGRNLGILAGDLLFSAAMRLLSEAAVPAERHVQLLRLFSSVACTTGFGQALDIFQANVPLDEVSQTVLLCGYHWKTAAYTFEGPMLAGAILAGADAPVQSAISRFARSIGQAYQLHNDLSDLSTPAHEGCDLVQQKRTVTLLTARSAMAAREQRRFDERFAAIGRANGQAVVMAETFRRELQNGGAVEQTQKMIEGLLQDARRAAADVNLPQSLGVAMAKLVDTFMDLYFSPASGTGGPHVSQIA